MGVRGKPLHRPDAALRPLGQDPTARTDLVGDGRPLDAAVEHGAYRLIG